MLLLPRENHIEVYDISVKLSPSRLYGCDDLLEFVSTLNGGQPLKSKWESKNNDEIIVYLDDRPYLTRIIDNIQRFVEYENHFLIEQEKKYGENANDTCIRYHRKEFSQRDYAEYNMSIGYSVCGFCDLSNFHDMIFINPLWGEVFSDLPNDYWLMANMDNGKITQSKAIDIIMKRKNISLQDAEKYFRDQFM